MGEHLNIWISKDGQIWDYNEAVLNKEGMDSTLCIYSVVWTGDKFIAVGDKGEILSSTDGSDWQREDYVTNRNLKDIIYSEGKFIAIMKRV